MPRKLRVIVALSVVTSLTVFLLGTVSAQTTPSQGTGASYAQAFLDRLAAALGIERARLDAAAKEAGGQVIDQALRDGWLTQAEADRLRQRVDAGAWMVHPGPFGGHRGGFFHGMKGMHGADLDAAANALGMTRADLVTELQNGKTLGEVADARGVDRQAVRDALVAAYKARLDAAVQNGTLTQEQADLMLRLFQTVDPLEQPLRGCRWKTGTGSTGAGASWRGAVTAPMF